MTDATRAFSQILQSQSIGGVRIIGRHVVWRCAKNKFAVWSECNIYSTEPPGCRHNLSQVIEILAQSHQ